MTPNELLSAHPIFHRAQAVSLQTLSAASELRTYEPGHIVVREGGDQTHILVVGEGQLELYRRNREAQTQMLVGLLEPPAIFGDAELYSESRKWSISARAAGTVRLLRVPNPVFDEVVERDPAMSVALYRDACARHMLVINIMQIFALQKTQHKILRLLWSASVLEKSGARRAPLSPTRMAQALGMDRKTVGRNLDALAKGGFLVKEGSTVLIRLPEEMAYLAKLGKHGLGASWRLADENASNGAPEPEPETSPSRGRSMRSRT